jgi:hypothetical protein
MSNSTSSRLSRLNMALIPRRLEPLEEIWGNPEELAFWSG